MIQDSYVIIDNSRIAPDTFLMALSGDTSGIHAPGQFVDLSIPELFLRRPFSILSWDKEHFKIMYKVTGLGTKRMTTLGPGTVLDVLTGLGNGFDLSRAGDSPLLIAGGSGVSPIYCLAERLCRSGITPDIVMGFKSASNVVFADELRELGCGVRITTEDGSCGRQGFVTDSPENFSDHSFLYCCGPIPMMKAIGEKVRTHVQFSFEARMGCGFGACMGCSMMTAMGTRRICKDGPVFDVEELLW